MPSPPATGTRVPLTAERIHRAALAIIDQRGLESLTMRRLGAALGVQAMSLYKHVPNRDAVVEGARELLFQELSAMRPERARRDDGLGALTELALAFHRVCRAHPRALALFAADADRAYAASAPLYEPVLRALVADGYPATVAATLVRAMARFVLSYHLLEGVTLQGTRPLGAYEVAELGSGHPLMAGLIDAVQHGGRDDLFQPSLEALLHGLATRLHPPELRP